MGFLVADEIYRKFPDIDEGGLTRLKVSIISGETLSKVAHERGFECLILDYDDMKGQEDGTLRLF